jgi:hypothetical protein
MQILHFVTSTSTNVGGTVRAQIDLASSLVSIGHRVVIGRPHGMLDGWPMRQKAVIEAISHASWQRMVIGSIGDSFHRSF